MRCVLGNEPDPGRVTGHASRQSNDRLNQRHRILAGPSGQPSYAAQSTIRSDHCPCLHRLARAMFIPLECELELAATCLKPKEPPPENNSCARRLRLLRQSLDELRAFYHQVRLAKRDFGNTTVGEQLKSADFVNYGSPASLTHDFVHPCGNDQRSAPRIQSPGALKKLDVEPRLGEKEGCKHPCCRSSNNGNIATQVGLSSQLLPLAHHKFDKWRRGTRQRKGSGVDSWSARS